MHALLHSVPLACSRPAPTLGSTGDSWTLMGYSGSISCGFTAPFSWSWCTQCFVFALHESVFPVLCKFSQLYGGVNGNLLQEGLYHTQVYCTQRPFPCSSPLLTRTSSGNTQTLFCLSLCEVSGSWCIQGMSEPSLAGMGFDSKCHFTSPTILLGLQRLEISSKKLEIPREYFMQTWAQ